MKREGRVSPAQRQSSAPTVSRRAAAIRAEICENARLAVERDPVRLTAETEEREMFRRVWRAIVLAKDLETCEGLLRGEQVPLDRLDPESVRTLGLRDAV